MQSTLGAGHGNPKGEGKEELEGVVAAAVVAAEEWFGKIQRRGESVPRQDASAALRVCGR